MNIIGDIKKVLCNKEDLVFLCIGCPKYPLDSFAPRLGSKLKEAGFTVYGTVEKPIDGKNYIEECLKVMFENEDKKYPHCRAASVAVRINLSVYFSFSASGMASVTSTSAFCL